MSATENLPWNKRLLDEDELAGHTILAVFVEPSNKSGESRADLVLVTETGCFLIFNAESDACGEDAHIELAGHWKYTKDEVLHDFVNADSLYGQGVINHGEYEELLKIERKLADDKKARQAEFYRKRLAELGGAA